MRYESKNARRDRRRAAADAKFDAWLRRTLHRLPSRKKARRVAQQVLRADGPRLSYREVRAWLDQLLAEKRAERKGEVERCLATVTENVMAWAKAGFQGGSQAR